MSAVESQWAAMSPRRGTEELTRLAARGPAIFLWHYVRHRLARHLAVLAAVLAAVSCAVGSQYAVKNLVDVLVSRDPSDWRLWSAVAVLLGLVAGDNLLWRLGGWIAASTFVAVGGDLRLDLFAHLSGHGSRYFADRFPGALAGRITTVANAAWTIESSLTWTTIPPASAVLISIGMLGSIDWRITAALLVIVAILGAIIAKLASRRQYLHHRFAGRTAAVSGSLTDVVANIGLVRAFGAARREQMRLSQDIAHEMSAQRESLLALERLRLFSRFRRLRGDRRHPRLVGERLAHGSRHRRRRRADDVAGVHRAARLARSRHGDGRSRAAFREARRGGAGAGPAA